MGDGVRLLCLYNRVISLIGEMLCGGIGYGGK